VGAQRALVVLVLDLGQAPQRDVRRPPSAAAVPEREAQASRACLRDRVGDSGRRGQRPRGAAPALRAGDHGRGAAGRSGLPRPQRGR